ncbi:MAG TPA: hypothetical protein VGQ86_09060, partial [Candidatus Limnocylindria bacterium]|nr:hypothetical protein [Candidatus Limnocylindria bacterium]
MSHVNFDVAIERRGERYRARVFASPFGEPSVEFDDPLAPRELEDLAARKDAGARTRGAEGSAPAATREIGARLFTAAFQGPVWMALTRTLDDARRRGGEGARIRLHLRDAGPLAE